MNSSSASWVGIALVGILAAILAASSAWAAPADDRRDELKVLRGQIRGLQHDIAKSEETRSDVNEELSTLGREISDLQRRLRDIQRQHQEVEAEISRLTAEQVLLEAEVDAQRERLGVTLHRIYVEGGQAGARRMLGGDDPNQLARDAYYLEYIAKQRAEAIDEARISLANLQAILSQAEARRAEVARLESERASGQKKLLTQRAEQRQVLNATAERLRTQRKEMKTLQRDEQRMEKLIQGLTRIAKATPPRPPAASSSAPTSAPSVEAKPKREEGKVLSPTDVVTATDGKQAFATQKGKLKWPARGELIGRFGAQRGEVGDTWRGVLIRAAEGSEVRSVASGQVVYADWLRGFGNLMIIDHGDGYLTVYGNNEALFKQPGDAVKQGDAIAAAGATGGAEDSGVYFEIRYRGQAQDPARWISR